MDGMTTVNTLGPFDEITVDTDDGKQITITRIPKGEIKIAENFELARTRSLINRKILYSTETRVWDSTRKISVPIRA